jgi:hypothetical protein
MTLLILLKIEFVDLLREPGCEMWPECSSTIATLWVKLPAAGWVSFWGSREMVCPREVAGAVSDVGRWAVRRLERPSTQ